MAAGFLHTGEDKPDSHPNFGGRVGFDGLRRGQGEWGEDDGARRGIRAGRSAAAPLRQGTQASAGPPQAD